MTTAVRSQEVHTKSQTAQIIIGIALSLMTTAMLILAFPPTNIWPFAFFCLVPMLVAQYRILPQRWAFLAPTLGTALWVFWLVTMLFGFKKETWFIQLVPVLVTLMNYLTTRGTRQFHEQSSYRWFVLHGVFDWVGFEMIRSFIPLVHMHGFIGHTVHTQPWLIQPVSIFSIYGLDLVIILVNYALAQGVFALIDRKWTWADVPLVNKRQTRSWLVGAGATLGVWIAISLIILAGAPKNPQTVRVAAVQSGVTTPAHWPADQPQDKYLKPLFEQTRIAAQQGAKLVVWSELAVGFDPQKEHTDEFLRFEAQAPAWGEKALKVQERRLLSRYEEVQKQSHQTLQRYLKQGLMDKAVYDQVVKLLMLYDTIADYEKRLKQIEDERDQIYKAQQQVQGNMQALSQVGKEGALRTKYVEQLEATESQLRELDKSEAKLKATIKQVEDEIATRIKALG